MNTFNTPWARWARKTCIILLWTMGIGIVAVLGMFLWSLLGDEASVRRFYGQSGRLKISEKRLDLSQVTDVGQIRFVMIWLVMGIVVVGGALSLVLTRLRRLLDEVLSGRPFCPGWSST